SARKPERKLARAAPEVPRVRWVFQTRLGGEDFDGLPFRPEYVGLDLLQVSPVHNRAAIGPDNLEHGVGRSVLWLRAEPVPTDGHLIRAYIQFDAERSVAPSVWAASTWRGKPNAPWLIGNVHPCPSLPGDRASALIVISAVSPLAQSPPRSHPRTAPPTQRWRAP